MELIRDRYEPLEIAGRGGQGEVIKARDTLHDRLVALKVRPLVSDADREVLLREARTLLDMIPHAGVSRVRDDFIEGDRYYLVMDWIEGETLAAISARGPVPLEECVTLLRPVAEAMDHLHAHQPPIVHGDIKPANIVRTQDGRSVIVDFGAAARGEQTTQLSTVGFRAPEARHGEPPEPASDRYSLAATAYTLLAGEAPRAGAPADWEAIAGPDAARLERVMRAALAFDPERRPASAMALLDLLQPPTVPNNLPAAVTTFIGREPEIARVKQLLGSTRLLTLTGIGGAGKTRLALQSAAEVLPDHPDGVWSVELAAVEDPALIPSAMQQALGIAEEGSRAPLQVVRDAIGSARALVIMDNCEHLLDACIQVTSQVLASCPNVRFIATSREPLQMLGEQVMEVPPLPAPSDHEMLPEELERFDGVRLFIDRARAADPDVKLTDVVAPAIARIVAGLDGIPLAIELAAAQVRTRTIEQIADGLDERFEMLAGGNRAAMPRQQTLRAAMEWSYGLLDRDAQRAFRSLGAMAGTFTVASVRGVCGDDIVDALPALAAKSMITRTGDDGYRMLETIRVYAQDLLVEAGEGERLARAHTEWFSAIATAAETEMAGPEQGPTTRRLEQDLPNLRAALTALLDGGSVRAAATMATALFPFWHAAGHIAEGLRWLEILIERSATLPADLRAKVWLCAGHLRQERGQEINARAAFDQSLAAATEAGDQRGVSRALHGLGNVTHDNDESRELYERALAILDELGDRVGAAKVHNNLGLIAAMAGDEAKARAHFEAFIDGHREPYDPASIARGTSNLALHHLRTGDPDRSRELLMEALQTYRSIGNRRGEMHTMELLAHIESVTKHPDESHRWATEALALAREMGSRAEEATALSTMGSAAMRNRDLPHARELLTEAVTILKEIGDDAQWPNLQVPLAMAVMNLRDFPAAAALLEEALHKMVELKKQFLIVSALGGTAALADDSGHPETSGRLLGATESIYRAMGHDVEGMADDDEYLNAIEAIGRERWYEVYAEGKAMTQDETLAMAFDFLAMLQR